MKKLLLITILVSTVSIINAQWVEINKGLTNLEAYTFASKDNNLFVGTAGGGIFLSTNNGDKWAAVNNGLTNYTVLSLAVNGSNIYAGGPGGVFVSSDNGGNWTEINKGLTDLHVYSLLIKDNKIFAGTTNGIFISIDNGANWTWASADIELQQINTMASSGTNIFAGSFSGAVFLSTNEGLNWTSVSKGITSPEIHSLSISGNDIYASTNFNVFLSSNNGADWTKISTGLLTVYTVASNGEIVLAGSNDSGVHLLTKDSTSWNTIYKGLIYKYVKTISIIGNNIFVGTEGLGIYRRPISEITAIQEIIKEPTFTIAPNPFSTETTITFSEEQINTTVKIVDLLGIEYKSIKFNGKQLDIKRGDLNCGIYFIQILSENGTAMLKKIIIL